MEKFVVSECNEFGIIRDLFLEYSKIKGAESCFVSFGNELEHLESFYSGGALLVGYENDTPVGCIAIRKVDENTCEAKRLFIKPEYRGKGFARILLESMLSKARELRFETVSLTTKPLCHAGRVWIVRKNGVSRALGGCWHSQNGKGSAGCISVCTL